MNLLPYLLIGGVIVLGAAWLARRGWMRFPRAVDIRTVAIIASTLIVGSAVAIVVSADFNDSEKRRSIGASMFVVGYWIGPRLRWGRR